MPGALCGYNDDMKPAARVGLMVILFGAMAIAAAWILQRSFFSEERVSYKVVMADAGGLASGARVTMSGVAVGIVDKVELERPGRAVAHIAVDSSIGIPVGSKAVLPESFIAIGDKEIQIMASTSPENLAEGGEIPGELEGALENLLPDTEETIAELNNTLRSVQNLLEDEALTGGVKDVLASSNETVQKFGNLAGTINTTVASNNVRLAAILDSTGRTVANLEAVTLEVNRMVASGELQDKTVAILDELEGTVAETRSLVAEVNSLVGDEELRGALARSADNVERMTESGTVVAQNFEAISENGITVTEEAALLMKKANELADDVREIVNGFRETVEGVGGSVNTSGILPTANLEASLGAQLESERLRADVHADVEAFGTGIYTGVYDAFEANRFTIQLKRDLNQNARLRYGIFAGQPGIGYDYRPSTGVQGRADLFGLNDPQLNVRIGYPLGDRLEGWVGLEGIFERAEPTIGVTIRR